MSRILFLLLLLAVPGAELACQASESSQVAESSGTPPDATVFNGTKANSPEAKTPQATDEPVNPTATQVEGFPREDDAALVNWIREQDAQLPEIRHIRKVELPRVHELVDHVILAASYHSENYPESPARVEVISILTRYIAMNLIRYLQTERESIEEFGDKWTNDMRRNLTQQYFEPILPLIDEALALKPSKEVKTRLLNSKGDIYGSCARHAEAARCYEEALALGQEPADVEHFSFKRAQSLVKSKNFPEAIRTCRAVLKETPSSEFYPHIFWELHRSYRRSGQLQKGLDAWNEFAPLLKAGTEGGPPADKNGKQKWQVPKEWQTGYHTYFDRIEFYRGFYSFSMGDFAKAKQHIEAFLEMFSKQMEDPEKKKKSGTSATAVYANFLAGPLLGTINRCLTRNLTPAIELEEGWVAAPAEVDAAPRLELLLFCSANRAKGRYKKLWPVLKKIHEDYGPRGVRLTWITHPIYGDRKIPQELVDFRALVEELEVTWPAGMDISPDLSSYEAYDVNRASTHFYYIDRGGFTWHLMDPMHWDEGLMRAVIERVLGKPQAH